MGPKEMARSCVRRGAGLGKEFAAECSGHGTGYPGHTLRHMVDGWSSVESGVSLDDLCGSFPTQGILQFLCGSIGQLVDMVFSALSMMDPHAPISVQPDTSPGLRGKSWQGHTFSAHLQLLPYSYIFPILCLTLELHLHTEFEHVGISCSSYIPVFGSLMFFFKLLIFSL